MSKLYEKENENVSKLGTSESIDFLAPKKSHQVGSAEAFWSDFLVDPSKYRICVANINRHLPIHLDDLDGSN